MKMMTIMNGFVALSLSSVALMVHADPLLKDLFLSNYTNKDSTVKVFGKCSDTLKDIGITKAHELKHKVDKLIVFGMCSKDPKNCKAEVYMDNHCGADHLIATVVIDVDTGVKPDTINIIDKSYSITLEGGFDVSLHGGPAAK